MLSVNQQTIAGAQQSAAKLALFSNPKTGSISCPKTGCAARGLLSIEFRVPVSLALSLCQYVLRSRRGLARRRRADFGNGTSFINITEKERFYGQTRKKKILQRYFQVSPKLLGFGEACPGVLKVSCCGAVSWA